MKKILFGFLIFTFFIGCNKNKVENKVSTIKVKTKINVEEIPSVLIGNNSWMIKNLNVDKLASGQKIIESKNIDDWVSNLSNLNPSYCYYKFDSINYAKYGKIYNFIATKIDLAPKGWHIAKTSEWNSLIDDYNKSISSLMEPNSWEYNLKADNETGFSALSIGYFITDSARGKNGKIIYSPTFINNATGWYCSTSDNNIEVAIMDENEDSFIIRDFGFDYNSCGFFVRCVKDKN